MALPSPAAHPVDLAPEGTEAAARLASIRQALRTADMMAGKQAEQIADPIDIAEVWPSLPPSTRRCFAERSERVSNAAEAGLATLADGPLSPAAAERLRVELRQSFAHIERLFALRDATSTSLARSKARLEGR